MNKKHIIAVCALALCTALCIVGASALHRAEASAQTGSADPAPAAPDPTEPTEPDPISDPVLQPGELQPVSLGFGAQYIRTDGYHEDVQYPVVKLIRSVEELNAYYQANRDRYYMDGFLTACEKYDEAYFSERILVIVVTEAGSGSVRYQVTGAALNGDTLAVDVNVLSPEVGTCDMAEWHILIEPAAGVDVADESHVQVRLNAAAMEPASGLAYFSSGSASAALRIPEGWIYEAERYDESVDDCDFYIAFRPVARQHSIVLRHFTRYGICGTGLESEKIRLGDYEAWQRTYVGHSQWDFIDVTGPEGTDCFNINNETCGEWSDSEFRKAMEILETLELGDGRPTEAQAIEIAKPAVTVEYDYIKAVYDEERGGWTVAFGRRNYAGGDQLVTVSDAGVVVDSSWGE